MTTMPIATAPRPWCSHAQQTLRPTYTETAPMLSPGTRPDRPGRAQENQ